MVHEFPALAPRAKVHLVDHGTELLKMFFDKGHAYAARILEKDGVELRLGIGVKAIGPGHVTLSDGSTIKTRCVVWGGGLMAAPIAGASGLPQGRGGRIDVAPDFTVAGFPGVLVIGDIANIPAKDGKTHPQLGSVALAERLVGRRDDPRRPASARSAKPFSYLDKGTMAMIGRGAAIAQVKGVELHGKLAFAAWLGVHAALMTGGSNRVNAFKSWAHRLLRQGPRAPGARPERDAPDGLGGGRRGRAGRVGGRDHADTARNRQTIGRESCPATAGTTSSSSAAEPVAARWRVTSPHRASGS